MYSNQCIKNQCKALTSKKGGERGGVVLNSNSKKYLFALFGGIIAYSLFSWLLGVPSEGLLPLHSDGGGHITMNDIKT